MAGFFGFFDYTKPGPGVDKDTPPKRKFVVFFEVYFRKFWKLIQLNMLYFICCIPIITIGPATAGFTYVLRNFVREEHAWILSDFKEHTLKNFKQGLMVGIIDLLAIIIVYVNFQFYSQMAAQKNIWFLIPRYLILIMAFIYMLMHFYIYPIMVTFKMPLKQIFKNAFIFTMARLPQNIVLFIVCGIVAYGFYYYPILGLLITPFIVLSTLSFLVNFYVYPTIKKYMLDPVANPENSEDENSQATEEEDKIFKDNKILK